MLAALLLALLAGACARESTPEQVVRLYFESLGRDPLRAGALVSEQFHARHGLRHATTAQVAAWSRRLRGEALAATSEPRPSDPAIRSRAEAELVWLATQIKEGFSERAALLSTSLLSAHQDGDSAEVAVRVTSPESSPFVQRFFLSRGEGGRWRIDRIEQEGVGERSLADAFVAAPSEALRRRLAAALGVPAD
jgi:hypothetical protein